MQSKTTATGLTLIEVLIALTIMVIVILGASAAYTASVAAQIQSREMTIVMNSARSLLQYITQEKNAGGANGLNDVFEKYREGGTTGNRFGLFKNFRVSLLEMKRDDATGDPIVFDFDMSLNDGAGNDPKFLAPDDDGDGNKDGLIGTIEFPVDVNGNLTEFGANIVRQNPNLNDNTLARDLGFVDENGDFIQRTLDGDFPEGTGDSVDNEDGPFENVVDPSDLERLPIRIFIRWEGAQGIRQYRLTSVLSK